LWQLLLLFSVVTTENECSLVKCEFLMAVKIKITIVWVSEHGCNRFFRKVDSYMQNKDVRTQDTAFLVSCGRISRCMRFSVL
jgi:hypothetical protein